MGKKFKVFKDKSIEIPVSFRDQDFDEFLFEVAHRQIYNFSLVEDPLQQQQQQQQS